MTASAKQQHQTKQRQGIGRELTSALTIKLLALFALWAVCFSHPVRHTLTPQHIADQILRSHR